MPDLIKLAIRNAHQGTSRCLKAGLCIRIDIFVMLLIFLVAEAMAGASGRGSLFFIENVGQYDPSIRFKIQGSDRLMYITKNGLQVSLIEASDADKTGIPGDDFLENKNSSSTIKGVNIHINFLEMDPGVRIVGLEPAEPTISYFIGNDPNKWFACVPVWTRVKFTDIYQGVDLEFYIEHKNLLWRVITKENSKLQDVRIHVEGATSFAVEKNQLRLTTYLEDITIPLIGADIVQEKPKIEGETLLSPFVYLGLLEQMNRTEQLQNSVDDINLLFSTFLGGTSVDNGKAVAVDSEGSVYAVARTYSEDFPTTAGAFEQDPPGGLEDATVSKLTADGRDLLYSTYLGGNDSDTITDIAVNESGAAYVVGRTHSANFPTTVGVYDRSMSGTADGYVTKLNPGGSSLAFSTFFGGSEGEYISSLDVDETGVVYVCGSTNSDNLPTTINAYQSEYAGNNDVFITKFNADASDLLYSSYLGGTLSDGTGGEIDVDQDGAIHIAGNTQSTDFPVTEGALNTSYDGQNEMGFVTKFTPDGTNLAFSTFLGTNAGRDVIHGSALDNSGVLLVTGSTSGTTGPYTSDFPVTEGAYDETYNGSYDAFLVKMTSDGSALTFGTFLGGSAYDYGYGIAVDSEGNIAIVGRTSSGDFPTTLSAYQTTYGGSADAFVTILNPDASDVLYSTYLGGSSVDQALKAAVDPNNAVLIVGQTYSTDFPVTENAFDTSQNGLDDPFVSKIGIPVDPRVLTLTSPLGGERWLVEEIHDITWTSENITGINIEYSTNDGVDWIEIESSFNADIGQYSWEIPNLTSNQCKVRISDMSDPTFYNESSLLTIKGWILARLIDGIYEPFQFGKHSWSFGNGDSIDNSVDPPDMTNAIMWPESWWSQFDYSQPPYPPLWSILARPQDFPDWPLFASVYGHEQCYISYEGHIFFYNPTATAYWLAFNQDWAGSCFGFAATCFLAFFDADIFADDLGTIHNLYDVAFSDESRLIINKYFTYQLSLGRVYSRAIPSLKEANTTLSELKQMFVNDNSDIALLSITTLIPSVSHSINPYKIERDPLHPNIELIYVYDNNHPHEEVWIEVDTDANRWTYPWIKNLSATKGLFLSDPLRGFYEQPQLPSSCSAQMMQTAGMSADTTIIHFFTSPQIASTELWNPAGQSMGYSDSAAFSNFDLGMPIIPIVGRVHPPIGYSVPDDFYTIQIQDFTDAEISFVSFTDSTVYSYGRRDALSTQSDFLSYENGLGISNNDQQDKNISLSAILDKEDRFMACQINDCLTAPTDSLFFKAENHQDFAILNIGAEKSYDLQIEYTSGEGAFLFEHPDVSLSADNAQLIAPSWDDFDNQNVDVYIDRDLDGSADDTLSLQNHAKSYNFNEIGWYMVSLPVIPGDPRISEMFPNALSAYTWDVEQKKYIRVDTMEANLGYWLSVPNVTTNLVRGNPLQQYTLTFSIPGWYMIGSISQRVDFTNPEDDPDGAILAAFGWDANAQHYQAVTSLERGNAYWISVAQPCTLKVGGEIVGSSRSTDPPVSLQQFTAAFGDIPSPPGTLTVVEKTKSIPKDFTLLQNYPNPFNAETVIRFGLPNAAIVRIDVYNMTGQHVATILDSNLSRGYHEVKFETDQLPSGIYLYHMQAGSFSKVMKMMLLR